jgi:tetratricopeptide (TPR) repeat protein
VVFSPDGRWIVSGSWDQTLKLWDAEPLDELARYARTLAREALEEHGDTALARKAIEQKASWSAKLQQAAIEYLARISEPMAGRRADLEARQGRWAEAAAHFEKAAELAGSDVASDVLAGVALTSLAAGNEAGYRRACARLWDRDRQTKDQRAFLETTAVCAAAPDALADMRPLLEVHETERRGNVGYHLVVPALALHYRAGRHEQAIKLQPLAEAGYLVVKRTPRFAPVAWLRVPQALFVAMAYQQLGKPEEARKYLEIGQKAHDELVASAKGAAAATSGSVLDPATWQCRVILAQLRNEAEALISGAPPDKPQPE